MHHTVSLGTLAALSLSPSFWMTRTFFAVSGGREVPQAFAIAAEHV